jgi:hypothetical protein
MDFDFLQSNRFWAMVFGALVIYAKNRGVIGDAEFTLFETILGGFVAVRTVDRLGEKIGGETKPETELRPDQFEQ